MDPPESAPGAAAPEPDTPEKHSHGGSELALAFSALGVVYGDIGTSPLYAFRECFHGPHSLAVVPENILGVLSLIFWSLLIVISVKYLLFVLEADNHGEGGILALMALVLPEVPRERKWEIGLVVSLGLFGSALLYGDGMITPAISVLSALEGLEFATPVLHPFILPLTIVILVALFSFQHRGTADVSRVFSPIVLLWFLCLALLGLAQLVHEPSVLAAVNPVHAYDFFLRNTFRGLAAMGAIFLVVTGGEALYADMGHFGKRPIRLSWFAIVLPGLLINYFGQGALLLHHPEAIHNPFYRMVPTWGLYPMIVLAAAATVIASQAVISGAFSLTRQAVQLGYCPRLEIVHTSRHQVGQIYIPVVNWVLMIATILLVIGFGSSSNLSGAYGIAVSTTMVITTVLAYVVTRRLWGWSFLAAASLASIFFSIDLVFFGANINKIWDGGWVPLLLGGLVFLLMSTWMRGRQILGERIRALGQPLDEFLARIEEEVPTRVAGTAVFMTGNPEAVPLPLVKKLRHFKVLHDRIVLLTLKTDEDRPHVSPADRIEMEELQTGCWRIIAHHGFMDEPSLREVFECAARVGFVIDLEETTFFLGREALYAGGAASMASWRQSLFAFMARNATRATDFFDIPRENVVELGTPIEL